MIPIGPPESTTLSKFSPLISTFTPWLTSSMTFSCGISQSSKTSSHVLDPRIPSLSSLFEVENPFIDFSMINAVIVFDP